MKEYNKEELINIYHNIIKDYISDKEYFDSWKQIKDGLFLFKTYITNIDIEANNFNLVLSYDSHYKIEDSLFINLKNTKLVNIFKIEENIIMLVMYSYFTNSTDLFILKNISIDNINKIMMDISL